jgi:carbamoyl-phosphate synthase large subunit
MKKLPSILVTAIGAVIGQGILRSLRMGDSGFRLIGLDRTWNDYGAILCNKSYVKPCAESDPAYLAWLEKIIKQEQIRLILPGIEEDVFFFHDHRELIAEWPCDVALNSIPAIEAGRDKWNLHKKLQENDITAIPTIIPSHWCEMLACLGDPPFIAKARRGSGGRGQRVFHNEYEWEAHGNLFQDGFIVQKFIGTNDEEYTVGLFGYGNGESTDFFMLKRRLWSGATWQAEVVEMQDSLRDFCQTITRIFEPIGPTNYQFRRVGESWFLLEINPRISAASAIRAGFGFNESLLSVDFYLKKRKRPEPALLRHGKCQRYIMEHFDFS